MIRDQWRVWSETAAQAQVGTSRGATYLIIALTAARLLVDLEITLVDHLDTYTWPKRLKPAYLFQEIIASGVSELLKDSVYSYFVFNSGNVVKGL